jgi:ribosomal protein S18 acetylase RimI-like enzyme
VTKVRPARADDLAAMIAVDEFAHAHPDRANEIAAWLQAGAAVVAERDGSIVGYAVLTRSFFHRPFVEMLTVAPEARRGGIGGRLLAHLVAHAGAEVWTSTNRSNLPMRELLLRAGFTESGFIEGLDPGDPELVFRR